MNFELVDSGWSRIIQQALKADHSRVLIICPFIKERAAHRLLEAGRPGDLKIITRFDLDGFRAGVSDIAALRMLLRAGAQVRGIKNLHAKAYLIGATAIVTSANLTEAALFRNHEFGFQSQEASVVSCCHRYFDSLWKKAGHNLITAKLDEWEGKVTASLVSGRGVASTKGLGDEGQDIGLSTYPPELPTWTNDATQGFVKFFGEGGHRSDRSTPILQELNDSGSHFAATYPKGRRPRQVSDGSLIFMARLVVDPNDIVIYGRAVGMSHLEGRDDATPEDIDKREWKKDWPHYIRVHDAEFVAGTLENGISLNELMERFQSDAFASTKRNAEAGVGNTNPRKAYMQKAAVELTPESMAWLNKQLNKAFQKYGRVSPAQLDKLDWPKNRAMAAKAGQ